MSKVLIVDDSPETTRLLRTILLPEKFRVAICNEARQALKAMAQERPDLVILDICMPGIDGWELCRQIREKGYTMPILVLTVLGEAQDVERTYRCGASAHMSKPFAVGDLLDRVRSLMAAERPA